MAQIIHNLVNDWGYLGAAVALLFFVLLSLILVYLVFFMSTGGVYAARLHFIETLRRKKEKSNDR